MHNKYIKITNKEQWITAHKAEGFQVECNHRSNMDRQRWAKPDTMTTGDGWIDDKYHHQYMPDRYAYRVRFA